MLGSDKKILEIIVLEIYKNNILLLLFNIKIIFFKIKF